ncbi:MAG: radical SAM family heme chaperone HemW [Nitrospinae bacterium]|nr:radical SAM family heme chaperone HemW [Nitrospinota bacterium]
MKPLSLYVHIPFCIAKCGYCDFNSYALDTLLEKGHAGGDWAGRYADALIEEAGSRVEQFSLKGREVATVFFGGGTPSLFPAEETRRVLDFIAASFDLGPDCEITLEANPGAAEAERFGALREAGVNRISIGVQTFDDAALIRLDRVHTGDDAQEAFRSARAAGFANVSLDLMFGIPYQTIDMAARDVERALDLGPEHLSAYELTIEPGTAFHARQARGELNGLPDEETALRMWEMRDTALAGAGYERYEISNFAKPGFACRHNLNYWRRGDYLGLGAGAHSLLEGERFWNHARPDVYAQSASDPTANSERVDEPEKAIGEALMLGLRVKEGVSLGRIAQECGADPEDAFGELFRELENAGLVARENGRLLLSDKGTLLANQVLAKFL